MSDKKEATHIVLQIPFKRKVALELRNEAISQGMGMPSYIRSLILKARGKA